MSTSICKSILYLMNEGHIKLDNLLSMCDNNEELYLFLKSLLHNANSKKDLEIIVNFKKGLLNSLIFIRDNVQFLMTKEREFFPIKLDFPTDKDDINELYKLVSYIINECSEKKYNIINIEEIFDNLINLYSNKNLDELCKLYNFIPFINKNKNGDNLISDFYNKIHTKGFDLIKSNKLTTSEIFNFMLYQDAYYFQPVFSRSEYRNPEIFKYISITKKNKNDIEYLKNIDIIKKNKLYLLFSDCSYGVQTNFKRILLEQIKKIIDLKSIFNIFHRKYFDRDFTFFINRKIDEVKYSILDDIKENEQILFEVLDEWLWINYENKLDLNYNTGILEINYDFTPKYYYHIFKSQNMKNIFDQIKINVLNFFINENCRQKPSAESFIILLLNPIDEKFLININEKMNEFILSKKDFYQKEENQKYNLFKLFIENGDYLSKNQKISEGKYHKEIYEFKKIIKNEIQKSDFVFEIINNLIEEEEFYKRIKFIFDNEEKELNLIFFEIKLGVELCRRKIDKLEKVYDYLKTFFNNSKKKEIEIFNNKLKELKKKKVSEIITLNKIFENNEISNYAHLLQDSIKIKYKNSCLFMNIYIKKKNNEYPEKTEEQILNDSIEEYRNTCKEIILLKDNKKALIDINNLKEFMEKKMNKVDDMNEEIKLILEELQI